MNKIILVIGLLSILVLSGCSDTPMVELPVSSLGELTCQEMCFSIKDIGTGSKISSGVVGCGVCKCYSKSNIPKECDC